MIGITAYGCDRDEANLFRELAPRFDVVPTIAEVAVSEATAGLARGNRCISVGHKTPVENGGLLALSRVGVRYISTRSIGCNHIDVEYAANLGIRVGTVSYSPDSVADFTLMLMLMAVRQARSIVRRADRHDYRLSDQPGPELRDLTVGVVGTGRIGTAVIDRLQGFGCRVRGYDIRATAAAYFAPLNELLAQSDIVTLHTPLNAETYHLLDRPRLARMKRGAFVVNTGRGALLDTEALIWALERGRLGGAALDVLEGEEGVFYRDRGGNAAVHESLRRLQRLPNVLITPHTAYYTDHSLADMVESSLINCRQFESESTHA